MKVKVWDTYVARADGRTMHFDVIAPDAIEEPRAIYQFARNYLASKNEHEATVSSRECQLCHIEVASAVMQDAIQEKGYYIIEMENC